MAGQAGKRMSAAIVGICRFAFLGRGDWGAYAGTARGSTEEAEAMRRSAALIHDEARLRFRLRSFERLTLASLRAQSDPDFTFVVLSSAAMPAIWQERLRALCATLPQARLVFSQAPDVGAALAPVLAELGASGPVVQFRLDDDDCLCADYVARLARAERAMRDYGAFAFSLPRALLVTHYPGAGLRRYEFSRPFHAAGAAARLERPDRSIFAVGHYALMRRFPALLDHGPVGSLQLKFDGHDSRRLEPGPGSGLTPMPEPQFRQILARDFPFLDQADLADLALMQRQQDQPAGKKPEPSAAATRSLATDKTRTNTGKCAMNWDIIEGKWNQVKGTVKEKWGDLTDDELTEIAGRKDQLAGKLQEKYGWTKEQADEQINSFFKDKV